MRRQLCQCTPACCAATGAACAAGVLRAWPRSPRKHFAGELCRLLLALHRKLGALAQPVRLPGAAGGTRQQQARGSVRWCSAGMQLAHPTGCVQFLMCAREVVLHARAQAPQRSSSCTLRQFTQQRRQQQRQPTHSSFMSLRFFSVSATALAGSAPLAMSASCCLAASVTLSTCQRQGACMRRQARHQQSCWAAVRSCCPLRGSVPAAAAAAAHAVGQPHATSTPPALPACARTHLAHDARLSCCLVQRHPALLHRLLESDVRHLSWHAGLRSGGRRKAGANAEHAAAAGEGMHAAACLNQATRRSAVAQRHAGTSGRCCSLLLLQRNKQTPATLPQSHLELRQCDAVRRHRVEQLHLWRTRRQVRLCFRRQHKARVADVLRACTSSSGQCSSS